MADPSHKILTRPGSKIFDPDPSLLTEPKVFTDINLFLKKLVLNSGSMGPAD